MEVRIQQQRLQHIIDSYTLAGREGEDFEPKLANLVDAYSYPIVELALVEALVENWVRYPLPRGLAFLHQVETCLHHWRDDGMVSTALTSIQFEQITGLTTPLLSRDRPLRSGEKPVVPSTVAQLIESAERRSQVPRVGE